MQYGKPITKDNSTVVHIVSHGQSGQKDCWDAVEDLLRQPKIRKVTVFYTDELLECDILGSKEGLKILDENPEKSEYKYGERDQIVKDKIAPLVAAKREKWLLDNQAHIETILASKHPEKECKLVLWSEFLDKNNLREEFDREVEKAKELFENDKGFKEKVNANVKYFGKKDFGRGWEGSKDNAIKRKALKEHAFKEVAINVLLCKLYDYQSHLGTTNNPAVEYFRTHVKVDGKTIEEHQPFVTLDVPKWARKAAKQAHPTTSQSDENLARNAKDARAKQQALEQKHDHSDAANTDNLSNRRASESSTETGDSHDSDESSNSQDSQASVDSINSQASDESISSVASAVPVSNHGHPNQELDHQEDILNNSVINAKNDDVVHQDLEGSSFMTAAAHNSALTASNGGNHTSNGQRGLPTYGQPSYGQQVYSGLPSQRYLDSLLERGKFNQVAQVLYGMDHVALSASQIPVPQQQQFHSNEQKQPNGTGSRKPSPESARKVQSQQQQQAQGKGANGHGTTPSPLNLTTKQLALAAANHAGEHHPTSPRRKETNSSSPPMPTTSLQQQMGRNAAAAPGENNSPNRLATAAHSSSASATHENSSPIPQPQNAATLTI